MTAHAAPYDAQRDQYAPPAVAPKHRAPVVPAPLTAASHVNGYRGESVPLLAPGTPSVAWVGGAL